MMSTVANGGTRFDPAAAEGDRRGHGWQPVSRVGAEVAGDAEARDRSRRCTTGCSWSSTARAPAARARIPGKDVSGKTGTAQVISLQGGKKAAGRTDRDLRDHGWFVFFAPRDNPEIAGVIFGEHNEHGATSAPIAKYMMETYFAKKEGQPLPKLRSAGPGPIPAPDTPAPDPAITVATLN